jgi:hypothetical protein
MRHARIEEDLMEQARAAAGRPGAEEAQLIRAGIYALTMISPAERSACMELAKRRSGWPSAVTGDESGSGER